MKTGCLLLENADNILPNNTKCRQEIDALLYWIATVTSLIFQQQLTLFIDKTKNQGEEI